MHTKNLHPIMIFLTRKSISPTSIIDARQTYCDDDPNAFPLGLVCFYNKTHTKVYGSLACAPFICIPLFSFQRLSLNERPVGMMTSRWNKDTWKPQLCSEQEEQLTVQEGVYLLFHRSDFMLFLLSIIFKQLNCYKCSGGNKKLPPNSFFT